MPTNERIGLQRGFAKEGQATVEYAMMLAVVAAIAVLVFRQLRPRLSAYFEHATSQWQDRLSDPRNLYEFPLGGR